MHGSTHPDGNTAQIHTDCHPRCGHGSRGSQIKFYMQMTGPDSPGCPGQCCRRMWARDMGGEDTGETSSAPADRGDLTSLPALLPDPSSGLAHLGDSRRQGRRGTRTCVLEGPTARRGTLMSKPLLGSFSPRRAGSLKGSCPVSQSHTVFLIACRTLSSKARGLTPLGHVQ